MTLLALIYLYCFPSSTVLDLSPKELSLICHSLAYFSAVKFVEDVSPPFSSNAGDICVIKSIDNLVSFLFFFSTADSL